MNEKGHPPGPVLHICHLPGPRSYTSAISPDPGPTHLPSPRTYASVHMNKPDHMGHTLPPETHMEAHLPDPSRSFQILTWGTPYLQKPIWRHTFLILPDPHIGHTLQTLPESHMEAHLPDPSRPSHGAHLSGGSTRSVSNMAE